jgi:CheY-like chemotaxis protein
MKVETAGLVFALERSALRLACEHIDQWIVQANDEMSRLTGQSRARVPEPRSRTILVVDDDATIGPWVQGALEPLGYVVLKTVDPLEAIRMGRDRPGDIDLLLVDVIMPLMDGRKLAQRLRALRPKLKVLLMSGYELSGLEESGWPLIAKPFSIEELAHAVATMLGEEVPPSRRRPSPFD